MTEEQTVATYPHLLFHKVTPEVAHDVGVLEEIQKSDLVEVGAFHLARSVRQLLDGNLL